mgnify:FL=1
MIKTYEENKENIFLRYAKITLKSFVLIISILLFILLKNKLLKNNNSIFSLSLFVVFATLILSILGITDIYIYNNLIIGIGLAVGMLNFNQKIGIN